MFGFIKNIFIGLITGLVNASNHTKCVSLTNQKCMTQPTIINLHPNEYTQGLHYYPFTVNLDSCIVSCNTLNDLSKMCSKQNRITLSKFNMITEMNELKKLTKHISCECKCKFDGRKFHSNQKWK